MQAAEQAAVGEQRRPTFRLTRQVLTACVQLGVSITALAHFLGVSSGSVRGRAHDPEGTMPAALVEELTGLAPAQLDQLSDGQLTARGAADQAAVYPTNDVIRALLATPRHEVEKPEPAGCAASPRWPAAD
ncbi:hypothetical protein [Nocardioides sp. LHG3406-4]|uniref:hypothetical protein n=1 Tax=Nocardioides sp. LHG3406-4 TaxID=2804575 RepID=UPI003CEF0F1E